MTSCKLAGLAVALSIAAVAAVPAGAAGHHRSHYSPAPTLTEAARHYLAAVTPVDGASAALDTRVKVDGPTVTGPELAHQAVPLLDALSRCDRALKSYDWPKPARADIRRLITAVSVLRGLLEELPGTTNHDIPAWGARFVTDAEAIPTAADPVRHDLGLPPALG
jgi:hypothetical protein